MELLQSIWDIGDSPSRVYAQALSSRIESAWAKSHKVKKSSGALCVQRLLGKRCGMPYGKACACRPPGADHPTLWQKDGKPFCYVFHPYGLEIDQVEALSQFCRSHDLEYLIDAGSFYFPNHTIMVIVTPKKND